MKTKKVLDEGKYQQATKEWAATVSTVLGVTHNIDFYNVLKEVHISTSKQSLSNLKKHVCDLHENNNLPIF